MKDKPGNGRRPNHADRPFDPVKEAPLLSAYVDGELDNEQTVRVEAHLAGHPDTRHEVERLRRLKEVTGAMRISEAPDEEWEHFWDSVYSRTERSLGWLAVILGTVLVGGFGLYHLVAAIVTTSELPWYVKGGIFALCFGILLLLVSLIRERIYVRKRTRYDEIKR